MASHRYETPSRKAPRAPGLALAAAAVAFGCLSVEAGPKRCDWHGPKTRGETSYKQCVDYAALDGKSLDLPANVSRISHDGVSFCSGAFNGKVGAADIVYLMDNSGSMEKGENSGGFNTPPGDPFGVRDRVIRRAIRQQRATADTATAGFLSFFGLGGNQDYTVELEIEEIKTQRPIDISRANPSGEANLNTVLRKVWKHNPNEALLPKVSAEAKVAKKALTFWSETLLRARGWFAPESGFVKTKNHAIVLLSDGAIGDWKEVQGLAATLPPVYGIHLGQDGNAQHLRDLCALTKGQFFLVSPTDTAAFAEIMARIVGIITKNPLPKEVRVSNSAMSQSSRSVDMVANPDGSLGLVLDSIIGLKAGANPISIQVTRDDNTVTTWNFGLNVALPEIAASTPNHSCYELPKISVVDASGDSVEVYGPDQTKQTVQLSRSPSELRGVNVGVTSETGDKETVPLKDPSYVTGLPIHKDDMKFNGKDPSPTPNNGTVEVGNTQNVTLTWTHPRDPRETTTYVLLGKKVPVVLATVDIVGPKAPVRGVDIQNPPRGGDPVVVLDKNGRCQLNCTGTEAIVMDKKNQEGIPTWTATIRSPVRITLWIFDNLGQYVNESRHEFTGLQWDALPKDGDSATVTLHVLPFARTGQNLGTGAYLMKMEIVGIGGKLARNAAGELVEVKGTRQEYFERFGYVRN